ncbi:MAG: [Fe-Fe] hydrogenase large subunit C-terminal domain-containing protein [Spirochaetales bacterium]|uniref:[Fe-Fe] hydrogenase large subunit C-terminal domain-containing protein n=1 Tax=Candidatus Thalassospirochaeta sargassi TaxID=3119039 RepID=A0AAJ1ICR0_9SPIO|nr:[Fe-Fe] hydrogenase large subunit C-terminal domain-containing protein [Spirochaetales bacterium]
MSNIHSVILDKDKCMGCTNCISHCPTEAIRVRHGKASIIDERCIDCGECIRVCPHHAKRAQSDTLDMLKNFDFTVAVPAPTLYGQFKDHFSIDQILTALKELGFDDVFEAAEAADIVTSELKKKLKNKKEKVPWISSSCPAVVRLIQIRFPALLDQIVRIESPMEIAARIIKNDIYPEKKNIGVFFISPCPAKITAVKKPIGSKASSVDGVIAINEIFLPLHAAAGNLEKVEELGRASYWGVSWARSEGESHSTEWPETVAVDGIENVLKFFEELENGKIKHVDFIEAMACPGGCVGGALTVENPYISKARIIRKAGKLIEEDRGGRLKPDSHAVLGMDTDIQPKQGLKLDVDFKKALEKMAKIEEIANELPGLDCGSCGAPTCRALAEDIVVGTAKKNDCIFVLRDEINHLTENLAELGSWMPPLFSEREEKE